LYGIDLTWRNADGYALKFGLNHDSSHVGDEFAERTGIRRVDYTRQEYVLGLSFPIWLDFRGYGEAGWAFDLRNEDLQEKWRGQAGLEYVNTDCLWGGRMGFYAALYLTAYEEIGLGAGYHRPDRTDDTRKPHQTEFPYRAGIPGRPIAYR